MSIKISELTEASSITNNDYTVIDNGTDTKKFKLKNGIVDNLTSTDTNKSLSAKQGKVLKDAIDNVSISTRINSSTYQTTLPDVKSYGQFEMIGGKSRKFNQLISDGFKSGTSSGSDTRTVFSFQLQVLNSGTPAGALIGYNVSTTGVHNGIASSQFNGNQIRYKHNGQSVDVFLFTQQSQIISGHKYYWSIKFTGIDPTTTGGIVWDNAVLIDLTSIYGAGNEPTTVAQFKNDFPLDYYAYDTGSIKDAKTDKILNVGKNLCFKKIANANITSNGTIGSASEYDLYVAKVKANTTYAINNSSVVRAYYLSEPVIGSVSYDGGRITTDTPFTNFIPPIDCYVAFRLNVNATNVQLEKGSTATSYVPYFYSETSIPSSIQNLDGYGISAGDKDNYFVTVPKTFHNMKSVNMGDLDWNYDSAGARFEGYGIPNINYTGATARSSHKILCSRYYASISAMNNTMFLFEQNGHIFVYDSNYTDAQAFKTAMNGIILHYEATSGGSDYDAKLFHKRVGTYNLGDATWVFDGVQRNTTQSLKYVIKKVGNSVIANILVAPYTSVTANNTYSHASDKIIGVDGGGAICVYDTQYSDAATFKTAMSGVYLNYELANEQILDITQYLDTNVIKVESGGTITNHYPELDNGYVINMDSRYLLSRDDYVDSLQRQLLELKAKVEAIQ